MVKFFKILFQNHYDDLVLYIYVFWGWEAQKNRFGDQQSERSSPFCEIQMWKSPFVKISTQ